MITDARAREIRAAIQYGLPVEHECKRWLIVNEAGHAVFSTRTKTEAKMALRVVNGSHLIDSWKVAP